MINYNNNSYINKFIDIYFWNCRLYCYNNINLIYKDFVVRFFLRAFEIFTFSYFRTFSHIPFFFLFFFFFRFFFFPFFSLAFFIFLFLDRGCVGEELRNINPFRTKWGTIMKNWGKVAIVFVLE